MDESTDRLLEQYFQSSVIEAKKVKDDQLEAVIRAGMLRGRKGKTRRRVAISFIAFAAALLLVAAFLIRNVDVKQNTATSHIPKHVQKLIGGSGPLKYAADHGMYQPVNETTEYGNYRISVDGVIADRHRMTIFYTTKSNRDLSNNDVKIDNPQFVTSSYDAIDLQEFKNPLEPDEAPDYKEGDFYHGKFTVETPDYSDLPTQFILGGRWLDESPFPAREWIEVNVQLNPKQMTQNERTLELNRTLDFDGQKLKITKAVLTPLRTDIYVTLNAQNTKKISNLMGAVLTVGSKGKEEELQLERFTDLRNGESWVLSYSGHILAKNETLTFSGDGVETKMDGPMKLVIDTQQKKILQAPDERLKLKGFQSHDGNLQLILGFDPLGPYLSPVINLSGKYTDGQGHEHYIQGSGPLGKNNQETDQYESFFDLEPGADPQPLTFEIMDYPGVPIDQPFHVAIK